MRTVSAALLLVAAPLAAGAAEVPAQSEISAVTVFLSGAEVTRVAKVKLDKGEHTIVLSDVPASAVAGSIRVEGKATGKLAIGSVDTARKLLQSAESAAADVQRKSLEDALEKLNDERAAVEAESKAAETQQALVANLAELPKRAAPAAGAAPVDDWQRVLSVIAQGSQDASRLYLEAQRKLRDYDRRIEDVDKQLSALAPPRTEQTEVRVHLDAGTPLDADLTVRYQVANASWMPVYDVRLATGSKTEAPKLELARRAAISQRTGEGWKDVSLQLSTTRPSESAAMPELETQSVDFEPEVRPTAAAAPARLEKRRALEEMPADRMADGAGGAGPEAVVAAAPPMVEPATETVAALTEAPFEATFDVPGRVSVADTGEVKRVVLVNEQLDPLLSSRTVPKLEPNAYLYATFKLGKGTPLLPGKVYLFRDDTFVGTGEMPLLQPGIEHHLGFGVDDLVKVRHAVLEEKRGESGLISTSHVDSRNYRVTVKNLHERPIDVTVLDRIPVTKNQEIKIEYMGSVAPSKQDFDDKRGVIAFERKLDPDEEEILEYGYRISWPASKSIVYGP